MRVNFESTLNHIHPQYYIKQHTIVEVVLFVICFFHLQAQSDIYYYHSSMISACVVEWFANQMYSQVASILIQVRLGNMVK